MNSKKKFWTLIAIYQLLLIVIMFSSINGIITLGRAQGAGAGEFDSMTSVVLALSAAISVSAGVFAASWAIKTVGTAAISALSEREGTFGKAFVIVALAEALAVYGLIIGILLWTRIP
ncbi:MAG: ATPase [Promethearchaeota archaeon]|nr:MAG: ATPase [Candidatus Lokiarchaeota archaeon]